MAENELGCLLASQLNWNSFPINYKEIFLQAEPKQCRVLDSDLDVAC